MTEAVVKTEHGAYRDLAQADEAEFEPMIEKRELQNANFPTKLHYVLDDMEANGLSHVACWAPHGRCFHVHKPVEFVKLVLCCWFRQTKFASFQRQLNIYDFTRVHCGPDKGAYYNEFFLRGKLFLTRCIQRVDIKEKSPTRSNLILVEPNFYLLPFLPPTQACCETMIDPPSVVTRQLRDSLSSVQAVTFSDRHGPLESDAMTRPHVLSRAVTYPGTTYNSNLAAFGATHDPSFIDVRGILPSTSYDSLYTYPTLADRVLALSQHRNLSALTGLSNPNLFGTTPSLRSIADEMLCTRGANVADTSWLQEYLQLHARRHNENDR